MSAADFARLEDAGRLFGLGKSELIRRLVRGALESGPALSAENSIEMAATAKELRAIGRNIAQVVKGINLGHAPQLKDDEALFRATHTALNELNATIRVFTVSCGSGLRRNASLKPLPASQAP